MAIVHHANWSHDMLQDRVASPAIQLSGGEKRRVAIARAMYRDVAVIFADEPAASLDDENRARVQDLLLGELLADTTVVIATHDLELAAACDDVIHLERRQGSKAVDQHQVQEISPRMHNPDQDAGAPAFAGILLALRSCSRGQTSVRWKFRCERDAVGPRWLW